MASEGDPRVLLVMNVVLSTAFAAAVVWGLSVIGVAAFTPVNVATLALLLITLTHVITR